MPNTLIYIILSLIVLAVLLYVWMVHKSKKSYVRKDTGTVYYLIKVLSSSNIGNDEEKDTDIYILQSTKDGHLIHVCRDYLNKHFL